MFNKPFIRCKYRYTEWNEIDVDFFFETHHSQFPICQDTYGVYPKMPPKQMNEDLSRLPNSLQGMKNGYAA